MPTASITTALGPDPDSLVKLKVPALIYVAPETVPEVCVGFAVIYPAPDF